MTDIVNINKSVILLYSYKPNSYVKFWQNDKLFHKKHFFTRKNVLLLKYTMLRICRIGFFRLDENMVEIHVDSSCRIWTVPSSCWVSSEGHWVFFFWGGESEHIAWRRLVFHVFMGEFLYGTPGCVGRRYPDFRWFSQVALASVDIFHAVTATDESDMADIISSHW